MKRVVVTGLGVVSSIGNNAAEVTQSLKDGKSGIEFVPQYKELGFRSQVAGTSLASWRQGGRCRRLTAAGGPALVACCVPPPP